MSSSSSSNSTSNTTQTYDERVLAEGEAQVFRSDGDIYYESLDGGAIEGMSEVSLAAFRTAEGLGETAKGIADNSLGLAETSLARTQDAFESFADKTRTDQAQFFDQLISYGIPALAFTIIAWRYFK